MRVEDLGRAELAARLRQPGIHLDTGAFTTHLRIDLPELIDEFAAMYGEYAIVDPPGIDDFEVRITAPSLLRRFVRPQSVSIIDGDQVIEPLPLAHALPCLEASLNLAVVYSDITPLVVHAAALERGGRALVMPAPSGSGKSTLCAALAWSGWRLLSDEMAVFAFETGQLVGNPRPVSLKNRSYDVMREFAPQARFSRLFRGTSKGDLGYMRPPRSAVEHARDPVRPGLLVAPVYRKGAALELREIERMVAFRWLTDNAVNYASLLDWGFDTLADFVEGTQAYAMTYSRLEDALECIDRLHAGLA